MHSGNFSTLLQDTVIVSALNKRVFKPRKCGIMMRFKCLFTVFSLKTDLHILNLKLPAYVRKAALAAAQTGSEVKR